MKFSNFEESIKVKLIHFPFDLVCNCYKMGRFATEHENFNSPYGSANYEEIDKYVDELINGKTFPKYMYNQRIDFEIQGISRIALAQLTRDSAIFASESHGLRPLNMQFVLPRSITEDAEVMDKVIQAQKLLEEAYIIACKHEIPYPESRYVGLHCQTISVCASYTIGDFIRSCHSRTNNSFCDELNYIYRLMYWSIKSRIQDEYDGSQDEKLYNFLFDEKRCIDDSFYTRTVVFNGDFDYINSQYNKPEHPAENDWRKSGWLKDLVYIAHHMPYLLTKKELAMYKNFPLKKVMEYPTTYDKNNPLAAVNRIDFMPYYKEYKNEE